MTSAPRALPRRLACLCRIVLGCGGLLAFDAEAAESRESLTHAPSAFVRAQAESAVTWHAWTPENLRRASESRRCIYVFIGSPLSELTRETLEQTFRSEKTVAWLNENFFCFFVDAEAEPELAALAQHYLRTIKQLRGLPAHLWLTPELKPYDGANYLPPSEEWGKPGFLKAARSALDLWTKAPTSAQALATEALDLMRVPPLGEKSETDISAKLSKSAEAWIAAIDPVNGGFGGAPKLPEPETIRFLLTQGERGRAAALNAARALVRGEVRDSRSGGFFRRAIDEAWREPYRQQTLLDQARIALALFDAADAFDNAQLRDAAKGALKFSLEKLRNADGSFAAARDGTRTDGAGEGQLGAKVGSATSAAQALLVAALVRGGEPQFNAAAQDAYAFLPRLNDSGRSLAHSRESNSRATAIDLLAAALAAKALGKADEAAKLQAEADQRYFDSETGMYLSTPSDLPAGIAARVPISNETPSAEVLALQAGPVGERGALLLHGLTTLIEYDEQPPGEILLALVASESR